MRTVNSMTSQTTFPDNSSVSTVAGFSWGGTAVTLDALPEPGRSYSAPTSRRRWLGVIAAATAALALVGHHALAGEAKPGTSGSTATAVLPASAQLQAGPPNSSGVPGAQAVDPAAPGASGVATTTVNPPPAIAATTPTTLKAGARSANTYTHDNRTNTADQVSGHEPPDASTGEDMTPGRYREAADGGSYIVYGDQRDSGAGLATSEVGGSERLRFVVNVARDGDAGSLHARLKNVSGREIRFPQGLDVRAEVWRDGSPWREIPLVDPQKLTLAPDEEVSLSELFVFEGPGQYSSKGWVEIELL